jgi:hypothetical protein
VSRGTTFHFLEIEMTGIRRCLAVLAAAAIAVVVATSDYIVRMRDNAVVLARYAFRWVIDRMPRVASIPLPMWVKDVPGLGLVRRLGERHERPRLSPRWRMCPSV